VLRGDAPRSWTWSAASLIVALVVVAFWPAFRADYVMWDDEHNFISNTMWHGLSAENVRWMLWNFHLGHFQPLSWLSFGLQYELFGEGPGPGHAVNIALHAANGVLFFFVARWMLGLLLPGERGEGRSGLMVLGAALAGAFFAVHPLRVESVAWVTERRDVLSTTFLLSALLAYGKAVGGERRRGGWYWLAVALTLLSCASKAWGMSFFVVLMALDTYPLRRVAGLKGWFTRTGVRVMVEKVPFAVIGLATAVVASFAVRSVFSAKSLELWSITNRVTQACYGVVFYLKQTVAPSKHSPFYEIPVDMNPMQTKFVVCFVLVGVLAGLAVWCWKRAPGVTVGLFVYLVQVSPVLGFMQSGDQFVADRYSYLATMPCAVALGWALVWCVRKAEASEPETGARALRLCGVVGLGIVGGLTAASYSQTTVWNNGIRMWEYAAEVTPTSMVLTYYGGVTEREHPEQARQIFEMATRANPKNGRAWYSYGNLSRETDPKEAERAFLEAAKYIPQAYQARQNLGIMYFAQGRKEEAREQLRLAIADVERPGQPIPDGGPYIAMAVLQLDLGEKEGAIVNLKKALAYPSTREGAEKKLKDLGIEP
jgi:hypothetical protein